MLSLSLAGRSHGSTTQRAPQARGSESTDTYVLIHIYSRITLLGREISGND
jgi:hypothetical protein